MARAVSTWKFAITNLRKAVDGQVDFNDRSLQYLEQIASDTEAFASQMSEENFPVIAGNNRQVFNMMAAWMQEQSGIAVNPSDTSLPNPVLGKLCGPNSCYERL